MDEEFGSDTDSELNAKKRLEVLEEISEEQESKEGDEEASIEWGCDTSEVPGRLNDPSNDLDTNENHLSVEASIKSSLDQKENESSFLFHDRHYLLPDE